MVQTYIGDDRGDWRDDIRGVEATSQTRFDHRNLDPLTAKMFECHCGSHLEERQPDTLHRRAVHIDKFDHFALRNLHTIDTDSLAEIVQVGRGEESRAESCRLQHRRDDVRGRALAVRARDVDRGVVAVRTTEVGHKALDTVESRFIGVAPRVLKRTQRRVEIVECLGVVHRWRWVNLRGGCDVEHDTQRSITHRVTASNSSVARCSRHSACRASIGSRRALRL